MAITIEEAERRRVESVATIATHMILSQWYYCLAETLKEQQRRKLDKPDFSSHWISGSGSTYVAIREYYQAIGVKAVWGEAFTQKMIEFINGLIGSQLVEYGVELRAYDVTYGMDSATQLYILEPGQEPNFS